MYICFTIFLQVKRSQPSCSKLSSSFPWDALLHILWYFIESYSIPQHDKKNVAHWNWENEKIESRRKERKHKECEQICEMLLGLYIDYLCIYVIENFWMVCPNINYYIFIQLDLSQWISRNDDDVSHFQLLEDNHKFCCCFYIFKMIKALP